MSRVAENLVFTIDEYLTWEELQEEKHEYVNGKIFTIRDIPRKHVLVTGNIAVALKQHLRGTSCQTYISAMKLRVTQLDAFYYPDVMVTCAEQDRQEDLFLVSPCLIVEVLSDSTKAYDRGDKFAAYRQVPSLNEYVLVNIKTRTVECFRRTVDNDWLLHVYANDDVCDFMSLDVSVEMSVIFEDIVAKQQYPNLFIKYN